MNRLLLVLSALGLAACAPSSFENKEEYPPIRPDYVGVTVPEGMAPLRFAFHFDRRTGGGAESHTRGQTEDARRVDRRPQRARTRAR